MSERVRRWTRGAWMYATVSLVMVGVAAPLTGGRDRAWGLAVAWLIQVAAILPLDRALASGASAVRPWLGGIALRIGGLVLTGGLAFAGNVSMDLPVAYGIAMVVLLLVEAAWLVRGVGRVGETADGTRELDRTRETG